MFRAIFTNSSGILFSRVTGFIRDLLMASILGVNIFSDIFFIAFKLPNLFRRIFGEGAFSQTFIPSFSGVKHRFIFASAIFTQFAFIILVMVIFVNMFPEFITKIVAIGYSDEVIQKAKNFVAINFIYLLLIFIVTFLSALLHYKEHFLTTAYSTSLLNISLISAMLLSAELPKNEMVYFLSYGVVIGGILQIITHIIAIIYMKIFKNLIFGFKNFRFWNKTKSDRKIFNKNFLLGIWGNSSAQISAFLDTWLATFLNIGSVSYLYYGNRVFQLPLALFTIATTTAIFPKISKLVAKGDFQNAKILLKKGFWFLISILTISSFIGIFFSSEIIKLLFERGEFTSTDTYITSKILIFYLLGLISYGISKLLSLWLYANKQMKKSAQIATWTLLGNILFSIILITKMGVTGLALSSTLSSFILLLFTIKAFGFNNFKEFFKL